MRLSAVLALLSLTSLTAAPLFAAPLDGAAAKRQLFSVDGVSVVVFNHPGLSQQDKLVVGELAKQQKYYAAIAMSPDEGLLSEPTLAAANYHAIPAAETAARAACDQVRRSGAARCVIAAHILPAGHGPRALQMSVDATAGFERGWDGAGPKALALSPATGEWSLAKGAGANAAALADCNRTARARGAADCVVAIAE